MEPVSRRSAIALLGVFAGAVAGGLAGCTAALPPAGSPGSSSPGTPLPDRLVSMWIFDWRAPSIRELPADVLDTVNTLVVAMAQSEVAGTGRLRWSPFRDDPEQMRAQIAAAVQQGTPVLLGVGGADDGGITVTDDTQVAEFCDSVRGFVDEFGFTGIDIDLEPSGSSWTEPALVDVVDRLKAEHGAGFLIGLTVALYDEHTERWLSLARELGPDRYDYFAHMLYDYVEATDERLDHDARRKVRIAVEGGVPASRQVLGFMCNTPTYSSPVALTGRVWHSARSEFPDLRGVFIWESSIEQAADYEWTRTVGVTVLRS